MKGTLKGLSGNQLKLIALICMTVDHVGLMLLPQYPILRIIGRLAFPIYGYMIAEGCRYTRSMGRYLGALLATAAVCQGVYFVTMESLYMCILVTFSISVGLIWLIQSAQAKDTIGAWAVVAGGMLLAFFAAEILPSMCKGTDYSIDYGFFGILLPVVVYLCRERKARILAMAPVLMLMASGMEDIQWYALLALPLLALYGGHRGKLRMKWVFYLYYPAHLALIWAMSMMF